MNGANSAREVDRAARGPATRGSPRTTSTIMYSDSASHSSRPGAPSSFDNEVVLRLRADAVAFELYV